jgi:hypothetical protein
VRIAIPLLLVALIAVACGGGGSAAGDGPTTVEVTLWPQGADTGAATIVEVTCDPPAGDLPDAAAACTTLASPAGRAALDPLGPDRMCTELYGGPAEARIVGTVDGEPVDARLSRVNGCEIERWQALVALLPDEPSV